MPKDEERNEDQGEDVEKEERKTDEQQVTVFDKYKKGSSKKTYIALPEEEVEELRRKAEQAEDIEVSDEEVEKFLEDAERIIPVLEPQELAYIMGMISTQSIRRTVENVLETVIGQQMEFKEE